MEFYSLLEQTKRLPYAPNVMLSLDPGETVGWAVFGAGKLVQRDQLTSKNLVEMCQLLTSLFEKYQPTTVVMENYVIFASKTKIHAWRKLYTSQLIGAIELLCHQQGATLVLQMPSAKQFCTYKKLKHWKFFASGKPHANDAVRHGCYYLLFNKI